MFAVIKTGNAQHRVVKGEKIKVDTIEGEIGSEFKMDNILLIGSDDDIKVGQPFVDGASVTAKIISHGRGPKIEVFKKKRRKGYHKTIGHRQDFTEILIEDITG